MGELISSDEERNGADTEYENSSDAGGSTGDRSLEDIDSDEESRLKKERKKNGVKINNSFTGPYPVDPTDFDHNDKGPNPQFILEDL